MPSPVNRLKEILEARIDVPLDDDRPVPEGRKAHALPIPAVEMLDAVVDLLKMTQGKDDPKKLSAVDCCRMGAALTEIMIKAAAALEIAKDLHNAIVSEDS